ncbi:GGDEF domain-containing protein [Nitratireductor basaltis]|uniref:diguanylate cyclase n=1 Tax=Nitratireductor basaltis TaxID=472175 RepID=A0A084U7L0_9HYPH|nr:GGDEF domain-containing protein [Nitratireductor basaltis]KFB08946.1 Diguanylate cyclase [Nitratireductor basaltis]
MRLIATLRGMSSRGRKKLFLWTTLGPLSCIIPATAINLGLFAGFGEQTLWRAVISAVINPIILAGPLFFYLSLKLRELAVANHKLKEAAATDFLTGCLNRGSFSAQVENHLNKKSDEDQPRGALLVIDADHFKKINDTFGHHEGDVALKSIATAIRSTVRRDDLVGRLGGEEFGVFLPNANEEVARIVAERIRSAICNLSFMPKGQPCPLTVSVGCATFARQVDFSELFRLADERLYKAKEAGRNRVQYALINQAAPAGVISLH